VETAAGFGSLNSSQAAFGSLVQTSVPLLKIWAYDHSASSVGSCRCRLEPRQAYIPVATRILDKKGKQ